MSRRNTRKRVQPEQASKLNGISGPSVQSANSPSGNKRIRNDMSFEIPNTAASTLLATLTQRVNDLIITLSDTSDSPNSLRAKPGVVSKLEAAKSRLESSTPRPSLTNELNVLETLAQTAIGDVQTRVEGFFIRTPVYNTPEVRRQIQNVCSELRALSDPTLIAMQADHDVIVADQQLVANQKEAVGNVRGQLEEMQQKAEQARREMQVELERLKREKEKAEKEAEEAQDKFERATRMTSRTNKSRTGTAVSYAKRAEGAKVSRRSRPSASKPAQKLKEWASPACYLAVLGAVKLLEAHPDHTVKISKFIYDVLHNQYQEEDPTLSAIQCHEELDPIDLRASGLEELFEDLQDEDGECQLEEGCDANKPRADMEGQLVGKTWSSYYDIVADLYVEGNHTHKFLPPNMAHAATFKDRSAELQRLKLDENCDREELEEFGFSIGVK